MGDDTRLALMAVRRALIALLNVLDDALGLPRTVPDKSVRRQRQATR